MTALENNKNSAVRQRAAEVLAAIGQPVESKHWIRALANSDPGVRVIAAKQLGKRKEVQGMEALCKALKDEVANVRVAAAVALGQIGDARAIDPLIAALSGKTFNEAGATWRTGAIRAAGPGGAVRPIRDA